MLNILKVDYTSIIIYILTFFQQQNSFKKIICNFAALQKLNVPRSKLFRQDFKYFCYICILLKNNLEIKKLILRLHL